MSNDPNAVKLNCCGHSLLASTTHALRENWDGLLTRLVRLGGVIAVLIGLDQPALLELSPAELLGVITLWGLITLMPAMWLVMKIERLRLLWRLHELMPSQQERPHR